jgi:transposase-like protein
MGRKSTLTQAQLDEIVRRHLDGESIRDLAKEFGISYSALRERISAQTKKIKDVADQIVSTKRAVNSLPLAAQITAQTLAEKRILMQDLSADVALNGLRVAKRHGDILVKRMDEKIDDELMNDESLAQAAKIGTIINIHNKPANDAMAIASRQQSEPESTEITITGGMDMLPVPYDHPPRNRSEEDI